MQSKFILDTSYLSSLFFVLDINHDQAVTIYNSLPNNSYFITPVTVLMEFWVGVKKYLNNDAKGAENFIHGLNMEIISISDSFMSAYQEMLFENDLNATAIDLSVLVCADNYKGEILTFDKKMKKMAESLVK